MPGTTTPWVFQPAGLVFEYPPASPGRKYYDLGGVRSHQQATCSGATNGGKSKLPLAVSVLGLRSLFKSKLDGTFSTFSTYPREALRASGVSLIIKEVLLCGNPFKAQTIELLLDNEKYDFFPSKAYISLLPNPTTKNPPP